MDAVLLARLYTCLTAQSDLRILRSVGSWDRGTTITVQTDQNIPLLDILSEVPGVEAKSVKTGKEGGPWQTGGVGGAVTERIEVRLNADAA